MLEIYNFASTNIASIFSVKMQGFFSLVLLFTYSVYDALYDNDRL